MLAPMMHLENGVDQAMLGAADWQIVLGAVSLLLGLAGIALAGVSIRLARQTAEIAATTVKEQRENRNYPSDRALSDALLNEMRRIGLTGEMVYEALDAQQIKFDQFITACNEFLESVSEPRGLLMFFNRRRSEIQKVCEDKKNDDDMRRVAVVAKLEDIRRVVRLWPYAERRSELSAYIIKYLDIGSDGVLH